MKTKTVELTDGTSVVVGQLRWKEAKRVKQAIIDALAEDVETLLPLIDQLRNGFSDKKALAGIGQVLLGVLENVNETFLQGCLADYKLTDALAYEEYLQLSSAAAELNDLQVLLALEKNSPAGRLVANLWSQMAPAIAPKTSLTEQLGTEDWKLAAFDPAGPSAT